MYWSPKKAKVPIKIAALPEHLLPKQESRRANNIRALFYHSLFRICIISMETLWGIQWVRPLYMRRMNQNIIADLTALRLLIKIRREYSVPALIMLNPFTALFLLYSKNEIIAKRLARKMLLLIIQILMTSTNRLIIIWEISEIEVIGLLIWALIQPQC